MGDDPAPCAHIVVRSGGWETVGGARLSGPSRDRPPKLAGVWEEAGF